MNNNQKATKRALLTSVMALVMCVVMLVGTTFAWFTDTASTAVNKIQAGNLKVDIVDKEDNSLDGKTLKFIQAVSETEKARVDDVLWEPGATFNLDSFKIVNKGNLAFKYKVVISGVDGNAKLLKAIDFSVKIGDAEKVALADWDGILLPEGKTATAGTKEEVKETSLITISGTMKKEAGNEYQGLSIDGIGITVYATQYTHEYDSFGNQYDVKAGEDTAYYTLDAFNKLTAIPEGIKNVHIALGTVSLKDGSVVIGNDNLRDKYGRGTSNGEITYTEKAGINLIIDGGTIKDGPVVDYAAANKIAFRIPDKSTVTFKNVKIEDFFGLSGATSDNPYGSVMPHMIEEVIFDGCTFDALWLQDGSFGTKQITIKNCTFSKCENSVSPSNTNPLWFKSIGQEAPTGIHLYTNVSIDNCVFNTNRPVKVVEQDVKGQTISITNCTFNMESDTSNKNAAIMFSTTSAGSTLGNVVVSGNKVNGGVALLTFYKPANIEMAEDATFTVSNNTLETAVKNSVIWKTATEYKPDFVTFN